MLAGTMESNSLREEPIVINNQQDPLENVLGHLYPPTSMKGSKHSQPDDPLGNAHFISLCLKLHGQLWMDLFHLETHVKSKESYHDRTC